MLSTKVIGGFKNHFKNLLKTVEHYIYTFCRRGIEYANCIPCRDVRP